jgi:glycerophosphoryl diester phosphodiesterase
MAPVPPDSNTPKDPTRGPGIRLRVLDEPDATLPARWQRQGHALVLGHRGARHAAPENTLEAFDLSRREGAAGTELDVQLSRDGVPFVVHDLDLGRVTSGADTRRVAELDAAELDRVLLTGNARIPRLSTVVAWAREHGQLLNVELKTARSRRDRVAENVAALLCGDEWASEWVVVSSFHPLLLGRFRVHAPRIATGLLLSARHAGVVGPGWIALLGCQAIHPEARTLLDPSRAARLPRGLPLNLWTVNDPEQAAVLDSLGANALISDCPGKLVQRLGL